MALENEITRVAENEFYSAAYNRFITEGKLMGSKCQKCGSMYVPPRPICPKCHARKAKLVEMKAKGNLLPIL